VLTQLEKHYCQLLVDGSKRLLDEVRRISATLDRNVDILGPTGVEFSGVAVSINDDGSLRVRDCFGEEKSFYAGDVSLRPGKD
jgi:biotin-(acetyl-CoA carboxylase) ligase